MGESSRNSTNPPERDRPARSSKPANRLQDEVVQQWLVDSVMKIADTNHDQKLSKDDLKDAIKKTDKSRPGLANFNKEEYKAATRIRDEYDVIKDLVHDGKVLKDRDLSKADLKKYVEDKLDNSQLANYFDAKLQKMAMTSEMKNEHNNSLETDRLKFTGEVLKAMANGDPTELAKILSSNNWMASADLTRYTNKINDIVKEKGGSISFSEKGGGKVFENILFPHISGKSINPVRDAGPSTPGMVIYPSKTEHMKAFHELHLSAANFLL